MFACGWFLFKSIVIRLLKCMEIVTSWQLIQSFTCLIKNNFLLSFAVFFPYLCSQYFLCTISLVFATWLVVVANPQILETIKIFKEMFKVFNNYSKCLLAFFSLSVLCRHKKHNCIYLYVFDWIEVECMLFSFYWNV